MALIITMHYTYYLHLLILYVHSQDGVTPLIVAALMGWLPIIELLIQSGAHVRHCDYVSNVNCMYVYLCYMYMLLHLCTCEIGYCTSRSVTNEFISGWSQVLPITLALDDCAERSCMLLVGCSCCLVSGFLLFLWLGLCSADIEKLRWMANSFTLANSGNITSICWCLVNSPAGQAATYSLSCRPSLAILLRLIRSAFWTIISPLWTNASDQCPDSPPENNQI